MLLTATVTHDIVTGTIKVRDLLQLNRRRRLSFCSCCKVLVQLYVGITHSITFDYMHYFPFGLC